MALWDQSRWRLRLFGSPEVLCLCSPERAASKLRFWRHLEMRAETPYESESAVVSRSWTFEQSPLGPIDTESHLDLSYTDVVFERTKPQPITLPWREGAEADTTEAMSSAEDAMEHRSVQFVLRNIGRLERYSDDYLSWEYEAAGRLNAQSEELEGLRATMSGPLPAANQGPLTTALLYDYMAKHDRLFRNETWTRFAGQALKEDVPGPLWKFFPDEEAFEAYGQPTSERLKLSEDE